VQDFSDIPEGFLLIEYPGCIENSGFSVTIRRHPSCIHIISRRAIENLNDAGRAFLLGDDPKLQHLG
jgi:hypothetical protein